MKWRLVKVPSRQGRVAHPEGRDQLSPVHLEVGQRRFQVSFGDELLNGPVGGRESPVVADDKDLACRARQIANRSRILEGRGKRLFAENVLACGQGLARCRSMAGIGNRDVDGLDGVEQGLL